MANSKFCLNSMIYVIVRKLLFFLPSETAHHFVLNVLWILSKLKLLKPPKNKKNSFEIMGLTLPGRYGLAAGFDKNGDYIEALACLGFDFIEIGTVTPKPQAGNPTPRLFRLKKEKALINRMGFNNKGLEVVIQNLKKTQFKGVLGINIGKNANTPLEKSIFDYVKCFKAMAPYASYITINISSPNTPRLRELQQDELLKSLLKTLKQEQNFFFLTEKKYVPLAVKISPDLTFEELSAMAKIFLEEKIDAVIATNTTIQRFNLSNPLIKESGGLSGKPLKNISTQVVKQLKGLLQNKIPIIGCGGIFSVEDALEKFEAGASLIQIYSGLIYEGPGLIKKLHASCYKRPQQL